MIDLGTGSDDGLWTFGWSAKPADGLDSLSVYSDSLDRVDASCAVELREVADVSISGASFSVESSTFPLSGFLSAVLMSVSREQVKAVMEDVKAETESSEASLWRTWPWGACPWVRSAWEPGRLQKEFMTLVTIAKDSCSPTTY